MKIYDYLKTVENYIDINKYIKIEEKKNDFQTIMNYIRRFKKVDSNTKILEIGSGLGWFLIICKMMGFNCEGIDISPQLIRFARNLGKKYDIDLNVKLGNIEKIDISKSKYDIIIASVVFEHVKLWQKGIKNVYNALKPGGVFFFSGPNKFALKNGEFYFPFYGWLPNKLRYKLRIWFHGKDIMKLGIDFNQFTYFHLRRFFLSIGFSKVMDFLEATELRDIINSKPIKRAAFNIIKQSKLIRNLMLFFNRNIVFICIK